MREPNNLLEFSYFPPSLETIIFDELYVSVSPEVFDKLQSFKDLHELKCELLHLTIPPAPDMLLQPLVESDEVDELNKIENVQLLGITDDLYDYIFNQYSSFIPKVKVNLNLIERQMVDLKDITLITIKKGSPNFNILDQLDNVQEIVMEYDLNERQSQIDDYCFDCHDMEILPHVKTLHIHNYSERGICPECFSKLLDSTPNLKKISIEMKLFNDSQMTELITKKPNLKVLRLDCKSVS